MSHTVRDVENVGKGHLHHAVSTIGRNVGHGHSVFSGSCHVYHVVACGEHSYILQLGQALERFLIKHHLVHEHRVGICCPCDDVITVCAVVDHHFSQTLQFIPAKVSGIHSISV